MEIIDIAQEILALKKNLRDARGEILERGDRKSKAITDYKRTLAICMIRLKNGKEMSLDGETIKNPPATIMKYIAEGICFNENLEMEKAESRYKSLMVGIESLQAEINALQSLSKYLDKA